MCVAWRVEEKNTDADLYTPRREISNEKIYYYYVLTKTFGNVKHKPLCNSDDDVRWTLKTVYIVYKHCCTLKYSLDAIFLKIPTGVCFINIISVAHSMI